MLINEDYFTRTQTLQVFTKIIKTESIHKSYKNYKLDGLGSDT